MDGWKHNCRWNHWTWKRSNTDLNLSSLSRTIQIRTTKLTTGINLLFSSLSFFFRHENFKYCRSQRLFVRSLTLFWNSLVNATIACKAQHYPIIPLLYKISNFKQQRISKIHGQITAVFADLKQELCRRRCAAHLSFLSYSCFQLRSELSRSHSTTLIQNDRSHPCQVQRIGDLLNEALLHMKSTVANKANLQISCIRILINGDVVSNGMMIAIQLDSS